MWAATAPAASKPLAWTPSTVSALPHCGTCEAAAVPVISIRPHPLFVRDGAELHCEVPIPFAQATLGADVEVPTLDGKVKLRIPEGTQSGKIFRLRGKGLHTLRSGGRGDQLVRIFVEVPTKLTDRQRELLEQFAQESGTEVSPVTRGFLEKLRDLFD